MMNTLLLVILGITVIGWATMGILYHRERRDLLNRIMAANYTEYVKSQTPPPKPRENPLQQAIKGAYRNLRNLDDE
jgi:hypothetical protein